ncbi:SpoVR family protein [Desulfonema ishimotonii]|uniref:SpoVR family protein n=1 Tax=Desulfonema ishimotonii TaxID=45657 RepID=A0A401FTN0_9BACT|nr:SpoVR family protein [Desulfonema ishimotonii]GBC60310.1 SpoVR family protein [Desulfonema ishimotonii]
MELLDQHAKKIMEGCKRRARDAGLRFQDESLEYIVTNRDLIELSPKVMIPTLYDYWVHDVEVLKGKGQYELYPGNPYETVINTRPPISFYNDNNPDWLNVMIFYHVLGHIDFFQNNTYFRHTWDYDFTGQALSDKRLIAKLRSEKGREVDYVIEFARSIDNLVGYYEKLSDLNRPRFLNGSRRMDFYFDVFLQVHRKVSIGEYVKEIERYNQCVAQYGELGEESFFAEVEKSFPEFRAVLQRSLEKKKRHRPDLMQFLMDHSEFLNKGEHKWMKSVIHVVRNTSLFFQPQIRTKIMNEGWASYWHETLFMQDDRIRGHEVDFARVNAGVTSMPRVGLNPYALGMRLIYHIEEMAERGVYSFDFDRLSDAREREHFDRKTGRGRDFIFRVREDFNDFLFINEFVDQAFINRHDLFVAGKRLNRSRMVWEYYVKSRKAEDYRQMLFDSMYHPPRVMVSPEKTGVNGTLYMVHRFEGKPLVKDFIANTMMGVEYLWGGPVKLETSEIAASESPSRPDLSGIYSMGVPPVPTRKEPEKKKLQWQRVLYTMENRRLTRRILYAMDRQ